MFLIIGYVVILASALGTYAIHGSLLALWVPTEYVAIIGLTIGYFLAANDIKIIKATVGAIPGILKGSKYNKAFYIDALTHSILTEKINRLLPINAFLATLLVGGLVGGFASLTGSLMRSK